MVSARRGPVVLIRSHPDLSELPVVAARLITHDSRSPFTSQPTVRDYAALVVRSAPLVKICFGICHTFFYIGLNKHHSVSFL